jgi:hypothetical protein
MLCTVILFMIFSLFVLVLIFVDLLMLHLDTEGMNEDGSFIGQYGRQQKKQGETSSGGFATLV